MKVKVCGITNLNDAKLCEDCGADALGFIFYKGSKRYIEPEKATGIIQSLPPFIMKVGVFVNESEEEVNKVAIIAGLNAVQLHYDKEITSYSRINLPVINAYRVNDDFDFSVLYELRMQYFLLDAYSKDGYGGTGKKFDWTKIPDDLKNRIILAGGISIDNIEYIFNNIKPAAIDLSSSLEIEPGKKDHHKIKKFFEKLNSLKAQRC